jgi:aryl-alcohol dehydrogenase-like predicted oxidoreductase
MESTRRRFLQSSAATTLLLPALSVGEDAPKLGSRPFGKTGMSVSILGFGSGSRFMMYEREDQAIEALHRAIDLGITYIDTAHSYGDGKSEERIGRVMATRRAEVTLATKIGARKADDARRQIELSLKRLRTDRLDVLHIHALSGPEDLAAIEARGGVLEALLEARDQKITRAIGITCHAAPSALKSALERHDFDCTQMALNAAMARMAEGRGGMKATPMASGGFEELALPVASRKGMGVIAMKVFGQDQIVGAAPIDRLLTYACSGC